METQRSPLTLPETPAAMRFLDLFWAITERQRIAVESEAAVAA